MTVGTTGMNLMLPIIDLKMVNLLRIFYHSKQKKRRTHSFRHDQFIQKTQISVWQSISGGREYGNIISLEEITFSRANWPQGSSL